ncbi:cold shock CspA family protein/Tfp pilus assembly protein PilE [Prolinoborus sp. 3657]|nr:cold shock CspA family protein/Tfp pilus assembly protein PilE [Prolinoborus sp. 3657]
MMFLEGKIKKYNTERGFGFIEVDGNQSDIFFHVTDFPQAAGEPKLGERLKFLIVEDKGKYKAVNIVRLDLKTTALGNSTVQNEPVQKLVPRAHSQSNKKGITLMIVGLIVISILTGLVFKKYQSYQQSQKIKTAQLIEEQKRIIEEQRKAIGDLPEVKFTEKSQKALMSLGNKNDLTQNHQSAQKNTVSSEFSCDGRRHCSQMRSYEEAVFFLRNCPNTEMDGDGDGIPCERQFGR